MRKQFETGSDHRTNAVPSSIDQTHDATTTLDLRAKRKGRGASVNPTGRFEAIDYALIDDGWSTLEETVERQSTKQSNQTDVRPDSNRSIITTNTSPDIPFDQSINPYQGCEHGCIYCYARPSHNYWGLSSGLDFERIIFAKQDAAGLLKNHLDKPGYRPKVISLGANTDPYQPVEEDYGITRSILEVLADYRHPLGIVTKSARVVRDIDLLKKLAEDQLVHVYLSITSLNSDIARKMEPRASTPKRRLEAIRQLSGSGIPVGVMMAPVVPGLTDHEIEHLLEAAADAGAKQASWIFLRLPHDVKSLFETWLQDHFPGSAKRILSLIEQSRGGKRNDPRFHYRLRGQGPFAALIGQRFTKARQRLGLAERLLPTRCDLFRLPHKPVQTDLFA